jgi:hypothetical protein
VAQGAGPEFKSQYCQKKKREVGARTKERVRKENREGRGKKKIMYKKHYFNM